MIFNSTLLKKGRTKSSRHAGTSELAKANTNPYLFPKVGF